MKLLFVITPAFNPYGGGVQRITINLGKYFTEQGHLVCYYTTMHQGNKKAAHGDLYHAPFAGGPGNPQNISHMQATIENIKPDFVINQMPYEKEIRNGLYHIKQLTGFILLGCVHNSLFSFKSNVRSIGKAHLPGWLHSILNNPFGDILLQWQHWIKHFRYLKAIIDAHDRLILYTPPNLQELKHFVGNYKKEKVLAIPNCIPNVFEGHFSKDKIILHVGRLNIPQKRSDLLLDFWQKTYHHLPDWSFVIVGDGPYMPTLKAEIEKRNLPRVKLEGHQKPDAYFKRASLFMMPSAYEGFPNTILEAQSNGCIPLAFDSYAALGWIVNDTKDALLSRPFCISQMADQAIDLIGNRDKLIRMSTEALDNASRFSIEKVGQEWMQLFNSLK